ncbi:uncharacterized protein LOC9632763 isoform X1 [Selaginella moellendorffii]|uniref:uncharacterized protein LOC9632763 isoform X1 n=1 Tax=Selaginella moellendorffii TaxID=88036 RepID=UPI000D1CCB4C|nr:uncharacterized protein LOC9632763 isoform X1 [Selaginella moellendorffii]|eukprot:XP_024542447.1 uncharacterized protein LOC9632763 isoform X1 [Selaginella moellendorffii]
MAALASSCCCAFRFRREKCRAVLGCGERRLAPGNAAGLIVLMGCVPCEIGASRLVLVKASAAGASSDEPLPADPAAKRSRSTKKSNVEGGTQAPKKASARKKKTTDSSEEQAESLGGGGTSTIQRDNEFAATRSLYRKVMNAEEKELRFYFLESLMENARSGNIDGVEEVMSEMDVVGLKPGPRSFHGLVAAYAQANDVEGALQALRKEIASGETPLQETFVAVARLLGRAGLRDRAEKILGAIEGANLDTRTAWVVTCEELFNAGYLNEANDLFMKGANGGFRASEHLYDILVEENCKTGKHGVAINILRSMESRGRLATTFHYNCLLLAQGNANFPDIAEDTFEEMQYLRPDTKPDTESFNLMIQAQTRCDNGERVHEVIVLIGHMTELYPQVKPNARTYALIVECYVKFNFMDEAMRHFRALTKLFPGSLHVLHCDGKHGDPLSLLIRSLCLEGRIVQLVEVLDLMLQEGLKLTPRAMFMNRKGRTLVSSWIEPMQEEADIGCEIDFVARYIAEGGLTGTRRRWTPAARKDPNRILPDYDGYRFSPPVEKSYKQYCSIKRQEYKRKLIHLLQFEGVYALGENAREEEYTAILERLKKENVRKRLSDVRKPKAASKLSVAEMKEELEAQGLPTDGNRRLLYQRVQKARRINLAKGAPLWMPPEEETIEEVDEEFETVLAKIDLRNPRQQYRRKCFIEGVGLENLYKENPRMVIEESDSEMEEDAEAESREVEGHVVREDEEEIIQPVDGGEVDETTEASKATDDEDEEEEEVVEVSPAVVGNEPASDNIEGAYKPLTLEEKRAELAAMKFDFREMDEIEEIWGWTWERDLQAQPPEIWTRKREVELSIQLLDKVLELGGSPTLSDCAMLVRNAMKLPWPESVVTLIRKSHKCGHKFGSKLYEDAVMSCLSVQENDAAIAILTDMEESGVSTPNELLGRVLPDN